VLWASGLAGKLVIVAVLAGLIYIGYRYRKPLASQLVTYLKGGAA
jgi:hypothetical protein